MTIFHALVFGVAVPFVIWLALLILTAMAAASRGRSVIGWSLLSIVLPLFALVAVLVLGKAEGEAHSAMRKCPECAEPVLAEARRCKHCGASMEPVVAPAAASALVAPGDPVEAANSAVARRFL